ncbi:thioesterase family protein [Desulfohalovibrio reitneri]|uniref:thioesterase family protein n=1 Tax=Desulfohalovibrio reitneri TaxID=1307759 RepID=UPI0004A72DF0|nr:thioesterase family protein [Desulfohalovibrio reitneri]
MSHLRLEEYLRPEWADHAGQLSMRGLPGLFLSAAEAILGDCGLDIHRGGGSLLRARQAAYRLRRLEKVGEPVRVESMVIEVERDAVRFFHVLYRVRVGNRLATADEVVRQETPHGDPVDFPDEVRRELEAIKARHDELARPEGLGQGVCFSQP